MRARKQQRRAGSYVSESNYFNSCWQMAFWRGHFERLAKVKHQYDPGGLFFEHHTQEQWLSRPE
jgi:hypothetical protein